MIRCGAIVVSVLAVLAAAAPAAAQVKMKGCLSETEILTEQLVAHGVFLREGGSRCDEYKPGTAKAWKDLDAKLGAQFKKETEKRRKTFAREFKDKADEVTTFFDGRLVTYYRHYPLTVSYCENIDRLLKEAGKKGWKSFSEQAQTIQNQVLHDYKKCQ